MTHPQRAQPAAGYRAQPGTMKLLILRHAIAAPHGTPGIADEDRPLTPRGRKRFVVALVGHEPGVSRLLAHVVGGLGRAR
jgi:phosphohistidine phosphatase SixA